LINLPRHREFQEVKMMPFKPKDREYRAVILPFQLPTSEKRIDSDYYVEGFATTFNKPYLLYELDGIKYYEEIDRHALDGADLSDVIMQYDHQGKVLARLSNKTLGLEPTDKGLFIYADLSKSQAAKELYEEIRNGLITKMSWAFTVAEDRYDRETRTRTILKIKKVYDVSAVSIPSNGDTEISARSWLDGVIEAERREALERKKRKLKILIDMEV
jgi:HK97 family phage prohead protease